MRIILETQLLEKNMSILADAITRNTAAITDNTTAVNAAVAFIASGSPDLATAVTEIDANTARVVSNTNALNGAVTPSTPTS